MSPRIAIASLTFTLLLAVITFFALAPQRTAPTATQTDALAALDTTRIREVTITPIGSAAPLATLSRDASLDLWLIRDAFRTWPAGDAQLRGFLRLISQLARQPIDPATTPPAAGTIIALTRDDHTTIRLHIAATVVGGRVAVFDESTKITRLAEAGLATLFAPESLPLWRSTQPLTNLAGQPSRIVVDASGKRLELARLQDRWNLQTPVKAPAERARVDALTQGIARLTALRLLDSTAINSNTTDANMGLTNPVAIIRLTTAVPATKPGDAPRIIEQELTLGSASDASGNSFFASSQTKDATGTILWGPQVLTLPREAMSSLVADSASYIALRNSQIPAADVGSLLIARCDACLTGPSPQPQSKPAARDALLARRDQIWTLARGEASPQPTSPPQGALATNLLRLLCDTPADKVFTSAPQGTTSLALLTLRSPAGAPLDVLGIGEVPAAATDAQGKTVSGVVIRAGNIYRVFITDDARQLFKLLIELIPVEG